MGQLDDRIEELEEENTILREVRDDLMEENERLRKEIRELTKKDKEGEECDISQKS